MEGDGVKIDQYYYESVHNRTYLIRRYDEYEVNVLCIGWNFPVWGTNTWPRGSVIRDIKNGQDIQVFPTFVGFRE